MEMNSSDDRCNLCCTGDTYCIVNNIADPAMGTSGNNNKTPGRPVYEGGVIGKQIGDLFSSKSTNLPLSGNSWL